MIYAYIVLLSGLAHQIAAHYTFPNLILNSSPSSDWAYVRQTDNFQSLSPVTDVTSAEFTCYDTTENLTPSTATVAAGSTIGFQASGNPSNIYHPGVVNIYMANAGSAASSFSGASGNVWFKVYEITAVTDGGTTITFPAQNLPAVNFTIPSQLPSGQYLVRIEAIALHVASTYGGAQFYIACAQIEVTGGGSGTPGPLVTIPGVYTGYEPGILLDIYYPIPATYTQPGPAVWPASGSSGSSGSPTSSQPASSPPAPSKSSSATSASSTIKTTASSPSAKPTGTSGTAAEYAQCGGQGFTGATACASPFVCTYSSAYYSQCLPA